MSIAEQHWKNVKCEKCGGACTDPALFHFEQDVVTSGLKGVHKVCPVAKLNTPDYIQGWNDAMAQAASIVVQTKFPVMTLKDPNG